MDTKEILEQVKRDSSKDYQIRKLRNRMQHGVGDMRDAIKLAELEREQVDRAFEESERSR